MGGSALGKTISRWIPLIAVLLAVPRMAYAYVDPGTGAMAWQLVAATAIGCLFYLKRASMWIRKHLGIRSERSLGFAFATFYALVVSPVTLTLFHARPLPRFNDLFLVGIVLTAYLFTWGPAVYLLVISLLVSAWVLPPNGAMRVEGFAEWYRLVSFSVLSVFLIGLISRMKRQVVRN